MNTATLTAAELTLLVNAVDVQMDLASDDDYELAVPTTGHEYRNPRFSRFAANKSLYDYLVATRSEMLLAHLPSGDVKFFLNGAQYSALQDAIEGAVDAKPHEATALYAKLVAAGVCR